MAYYDKKCDSPCSPTATTLFLRTRNVMEDTAMREAGFEPAYLSVPDPKPHRPPRHQNNDTGGLGIQDGTEPCLDSRQKCLASGDRMESATKSTTNVAARSLLARSERDADVVVAFQDTSLGARRVMELRDIDAQAVQHELDHLDGVLLTDRVSRQQRRQAERLVAEARAKR